MGDARGASEETVAASRVWHRKGGVEQKKSELRRFACARGESVGFGSRSSRRLGPGYLEQANLNTLNFIIISDRDS